MAKYTDEYEEWKAQGRPGGSFANWQASQGGGSAVPRAPAPAPGGATRRCAPNPRRAPPPQAGAPHLAGGGPPPPRGPADTTKWRTDVPMADSVHPDSLQPSGDPFVDTLRAQGKVSEDYARFRNRH